MKKAKESPLVLAGEKGAKKQSAASSWDLVEPNPIGLCKSEIGSHVKTEKGNASGRFEPRSGSSGRAVPLPCLNSNNSIEIDTETGQETPVTRTLRRDSDGRSLIVGSDGIEGWLGGMSTSEKKAAFSLVHNVETLAKRFGIERIGFLTLTFRENLKDFRESQRRFNSLATNVLKKFFTDWMVVLEPQKRGAVHYHLLVVCDRDIQTGFDFKAFLHAHETYKKYGYRSNEHRKATKAYASTASPHLKYMWRFLRGKMPLYGFGRYELLPVKSTGEAMGRYVGKYLEKGSIFRGEQFKGARMIRYSKGWRSASPRFSWMTDGAKRWRSIVGTLARSYNVESVEEMKSLFGKHWAYQLMTFLRGNPDADVVEIEQFMRFSVRNG